MPAPVQITAEQLLREAKERELELVPPVSLTLLIYYILNFGLCHCEVYVQFQGSR